MSDEHWQLQGSAAELYQRYLVPAITSKWARDLVKRAHLLPADVILDVACGTGVVARLAAKEAVEGRVTGLDLNAGMLAVARREASEGAMIEWIEGSALDLPFASETFDVVLCQLGLQFFPDPSRALTEMRRVLRRPGRVALSVYSAVEQTPGAHAFVLALDAVLGTGASRIKRGEHAFSGSDGLDALMVAAGFGAVTVQTVELTIAFPSVLDYVRFQLLATPMTSLLSTRGDAERQDIIARVAAKTTDFSTTAMLEGGRFTFPQQAYVAIALKSAS